MRSLLLALSIAGTSAPAFAQARPTATEAQALLQARPELVAQLRQRIMTSGMTGDQVRARLRAEGYPENLLDAYLPGSTTTPGAVGEDVFSAIRRLGIVEEDDLTILRTMMGQRDSVTPAVRDLVETPAENEARSQELFGLALFRNATSEFLPTLDGPVDANYRLGPGDQLVLILTGQVELAHSLDVTREGFIVIPQVGQLNVANLTLGQLEDLLYARLPRSYSGVRRGADAPTRFSVSVSRLRAIQVYVTGDVVRPSSYRISSAGTAMTALYAAGGPTEAGTLRRVTVRRGGRDVATLDVYDYLLHGENTDDVRLENGDVIFVGTHGPRVRLAGEVLRPATYELAEGETLRDALRAAGGFRATASTARVQVQRIVPSGERASGRERTVLDVSGSGASPQDFPAIPMQAGDVVRVFGISRRVRNSVTVEGHVWTPGAQQLAPGMRLSDALRAAGGLKSDTYLGRVLVTRLRPDSTREQLRAVLRDTTGAVVNDIELREDDQVRVFSLTEFRPDRFVAIGGSVRRGGRFPWHEGMTLRDLVLLGGGLREGAYLREAEIARLPENRAGGITATTMRVPVDSSYLGDYVPGMPYAGAPGQSAPAFGTAPETVLRPYDNVLIMEQPDWQLQRTVALTGEVRFPGRYALRTKNERVSDLIQHAGGLTAEADADAAYFSRQRAATSFAGDTLAASLRTRVGVALEDALRRKRGNDDLILMHGDSLHVPFRITTVEILGEVNAPGAIAVHGSQSIAYYLDAAGGASATGDGRRAYVIQPNGKVETRRRFLWIFRNDPTPRAGASVVVPAKAATDGRTERLATVSIIAQTIASLAAVVAIMR
jgi:polysaccharide export outer membrane protein